MKCKLFSGKKMCGNDLFVRGVDTDAECSARLSDIPEIIYFYKNST